MAQLICGGCHTQLMYIRSANSVQCPCCHTVSLASQGEEVTAEDMDVFENPCSSSCCAIDVC